MKDTYPLKLIAFTVMCLNTIEDEPIVIGDVGVISKKDLDKVIRFIKNNKESLLDFWYGREIDPHEIVNNFQKINE